MTDKQKLKKAISALKQTRNTLKLLLPDSTIEGLIYGINATLVDLK
jgi:hypothetical protein